MKKFALSQILDRCGSSALLSKAVLGIVLWLFLLVAAGCSIPSATRDTSDKMLKPGISVAPKVVRPGDLITVRGAGWIAEEPVAINLQSTIEGVDNVGVFAIANAETDGRFVISFFYPMDPRWVDIDGVQVEANAVNSDQQASAKLALQKTSSAASDSKTILLPIVQTVGDPIVDGYVIGERVNLRMGPSTAYPVLDVVEDGQSFVALGQNVDSSWLRVRLATGSEGWMLRILTDFTAAIPVVRAPQLPTATAEPQSLVWRGEYYDNRSLSGIPVLIRGDQNVTFDWGYSAPSAIVPFDNFSARWTRAIYFPAGAYRFNVTVDDGIRLWIDGELLIDEWAENPLRTYSVNRTFTAGDTHLIQIDYFEALERAQIDFWWERINEFPEWRGAYFNNASLTGDPSLVRNESAVEFDWGQNSPGEDIAADRFSARWTRTVEFEQGVYRFRSQMDDGLRLFIDGALVIDEWRDGGLREVVVDYSLTRGFHAVRVEYYDNIGDAVASVDWEKTVPIVEFPDWKAEYWANPDLNGTPGLVRSDAHINFNWGAGSPPAPITGDNFSARWTRARHFDSGTYRFHLNVDDGIRMWIDGQLIVDEWRDDARREIVVEHSLANGMHDLRVEFYERVGDAMASLWWEKVQQPGNYPNWKGEYWSNRSLSGDPAFVRNDQAIDFSWETASPALGLSSDRFSARWTQDAWFDQGTYRLYARADDGVRAWVDDVLVIDRWGPSPGWETYSADVALGGQHQLKVEYFDDTGLALVEFWWQKLPEQPAATPTQTSEPTVTLAQPTIEPESSTTPTDVPASTPTQIPESTPTDTPEPTISPTSTQEPTANITATPVLTATATITSSLAATATVEATETGN